MAKFTAEKIEIDLELTTLGEAQRAKAEGDEPKVIELSLKLILDAQKVINIVKEWNILEKKKHENIELPFEVMAIELAMLYDRPKEWWLENFDVTTLNKILKHVAGAMAGLKKSPKNSKQS